MVFHMREVKLRKLLLLFLEVLADIARKSEDFCENGMHFNRNISISVYLIASLQSPLMRRNEYDIDLLILQLLLGDLALFDAILRNAAIEMLMGV